MSDRTFLKPLFSAKYLVSVHLMTKTTKSNVNFYLNLNYAACLDKAAIIMNQMQSHSP